MKFDSSNKVSLCTLIKARERKTWLFFDELFLKKKRIKNNQRSKKNYLFWAVFPNSFLKQYIVIGHLIAQIKVS